MKVILTTALVLSSTMLFLLSPGNAGATVHGAGVHAFRSSGHFHFAPHRFSHFARHHFESFRNRQTLGVWPWYGYYDVPPYQYDDSTTYPTAPVVVVREPEPRCQHSEQTVTVPSTHGGTRQVTILRC